MTKSKLYLIWAILAGLAIVIVSIAVTADSIRQDFTEQIETLDKRDDRYLQRILALERKNEKLEQDLVDTTLVIARMHEVPITSGDLDGDGFYSDEEFEAIEGISPELYCTEYDPYCNPDGE